jgi:two-component system osmolarity sensor histidine kinase EnvZ
MVAAHEDRPATRPIRSAWATARIHLRAAASRLSHALADLLPKGLYARALIIIITPIVLLEGVVAFVFMERHWQAVTRRLSEATARDIAAIIEIYKDYADGDDYRRLVDIARDNLELSLQILPAGDLPPAQPKPFFALLDRTLSNEIRKQIRHPFWIDTLGASTRVEIRVKLDDAVLRFIAKRSATYASNSHIFLIWMVGTSVVLLSVAILFLRNQIRPIQKLAEAADAFGKGRPVPEDFKARGAREVRQAAHAFMEMRDRITQHVEQRTHMLAGVSHDLRTVLTRFKLELALLGDSKDIRALKSDVAEMEHMLEDYLAFARGDGGEEAKPTNLRALLEEIHEESQIFGVAIELKMRKRKRDLVLPLKRQAFKRAITNLISNAARFGDQIVIRAATEMGWLRIEVDDNGPGIPPGERDNVFRPFYRLDHARNQDAGNTGLGLAIARDIAKSHGGNITLGESSMGGLRAVITVPL